MCEYGTHLWLMCLTLVRWLAARGPFLISPSISARLGQASIDVDCADTCARRLCGEMRMRVRSPPASQL